MNPRPFGSNAPRDGRRDDDDGQWILDLIKLPSGSDRRGHASAAGPGQARSQQVRSRTTADHGRLIMRKLIATVFNYSIDGLLADEGTDSWNFCFDLPENREPDDPAQLDFLQSADAHIMGRTAYEAIARSMTTTATDHRSPTS
jgi:hypothetical protein